MSSFESLTRRVTNYDRNDHNWRVLEQLFDNNYIAAKKQPLGVIPKKIHQIWVGGNPFPEKYQLWAESWKKFNPDYEYRLWTDEDIDELELPNRDEFDFFNPGPKSDVMRYHILKKYGGIYVDTDFECVRSFDDISYLNFYTGAGYPSKVELYVGLIGCTPNHPILEQTVNAVDKVTSAEINGKGVLGATSSYFFTEIFFRKVHSYQPGIVVFPTDFFYPFPNHKGHEFEDGRKYLRDNSYAIHHWEVSWSKVNVFDWIQGERFVGIAEMVYAPKVFAADDYAKYPCTFDPGELKPVNLVYTNSMYLPKLLSIIEYLPQKFVVISHNGDEHITDKSVDRYNGKGKMVQSFPITLPDNVIRLFAQNVEVEHPRITCLPIGLENSMWGRLKGIYLKRLLRKPSPKDKLLYVNHNRLTNRDERQEPYDLFLSKKWATVKEITSIQVYYKDVATHKFMICPSGNGPDTHRFWECLYLGTFPVVKRTTFTNFFKDFPVCYVDKWSDVTEEFLIKEYERLKKMEWNKKALSFDYWCELILETFKNSNHE